MAITRAQQYKQMLQNGGRIGLQGGGADASTKSFDKSLNPNRPGGPIGRDYSPQERQEQRDTQRLNERIQANRTLRILEDDAIEEKLEKFRRFNAPVRKVQNIARQFSPIAAFASQFGPLNTRDFLLDKVFDAGRYTYQGSNKDLYGKTLTKEEFANLSEEEKEDVLKSYTSQRLSNEIDAYGNPITQTGDGADQLIIPNQTMFAEAPSTMDQETLTPVQLALKERGDALRFAAEGGIMNNDVVGGEMDFESARQMYGLGKLVKKVTRGIKKIAKSPIGKAALLYAGTGGLGNIAAGKGFFGGAISNIFKPATFLGNVGSIFSRAGLENIMAKARLGNIVGTSDGQTMFEKNILGKALTSPMGLITATSLAAGFLTPEQEEEAQRIADETGIDIAEIRANPAKYLAPRFAAEGGIMRQQYQEGSKEPVAKKTMPLLDMGGMEKDYREEGGFVPIGRMEKADDVPARLSKNEFVFTADAVRNAGEGDIDKGAEVMYNMMKNLEAGGEVSEESQGLEGARKMFQTSRRLEEVL
jgi:hypothetical protein